MFRQAPKCVVLSVLCAFVMCSCDPEKDALKLFKQQGLTVLKPARDYIALGGIFVLPKHGTPMYKDPGEKLTPVPGAATSFNAIVMQQSKSDSSGFNAAVGTLGGLVAIPASAKFSDSKQVQLAQIDSGGTRYTDDMMDALIQMPKTNAKILKALNEGSKAFIVQELYTGTSLALKSSDNVGLAASVEGGASIPSCSSANTSGTPSDSTKSAAKTQPSGTTDSGATATGTSTASTSPGKKAAATTSKGTASAAQGSSTSAVGISVGVCWADAYTLSFQSKNPIPFAIRLNQVVIGKDKKLEIPDTGFNLPSSALGPEDVKATVLIDPNNPSIQELIHVKEP
jgi:hypothetical protein